MRLNRRTLIAVLIIATLTGLLLVYSHFHVKGWGHPENKSDYFKLIDNNIRTRFSSKRDPNERARFIFNYFLAGYLEYKTERGERIYRRGFHSVRGRSVEGLEGFARTAPLFAAWIASGRETTISDPRNDRRSIKLVPLLRHAILSGTDERSATYWGDFEARDQRIVEASMLP